MSAIAECKVQVGEEEVPLLDQSMSNIAISHCKTTKELEMILNQMQAPEEFGKNPYTVKAVCIFFNQCDESEMMEGLQLIHRYSKGMQLPQDIYDYVVHRCKSYEQVTEILEMLKYAERPCSERVFWRLVQFSNGHYEEVKRVYDDIPEKNEAIRLGIVTAGLKNGILRPAVELPPDGAMDTGPKGDDERSFLLSVVGSHDKDPSLERIELDLVAPDLDEYEERLALTLKSELKHPTLECRTRIYERIEYGEKQYKTDMVVVVPMRVPNYEIGEVKLDLTPEEFVDNWITSMPVGHSVRLILGVNTKETDKEKLAKEKKEIEARIKERLGNRRGVIVNLVLMTWETDNGRTPFGWLRNTLLREVLPLESEVSRVVSMDGDTRVNPQLVLHIIKFCDAQTKAEEKDAKAPGMAITSCGYRLASQHKWVQHGSRLENQLRRVLSKTNSSKRTVSVAYPSEACLVLTGSELKDALSEGKVGFDPYGNDGQGLVNSSSEYLKGLPSMPPKIPYEALPEVQNVGEFEPADPQSMSPLECLRMSHAKTWLLSKQIVAAVGKGVTMGQVSNVVSMVSPFRLLKNGMSFEKLVAFKKKICGDGVMTLSLCQSIEKSVNEGGNFDQRMYDLKDYFNGDEKNLVEEVLRGFGVANIAKLKTGGGLAALRLIEKWLGAIVEFFENDLLFQADRAEFLLRSPKVNTSDGRCEGSSIFGDQESRDTHSKRRKQFGGLSHTLEKVSPDEKKDRAKARSLTPPPSEVPKAMEVHLESEEHDHPSSSPTKRKAGRSDLKDELKRVRGSDRGAGAVAATARDSQLSRGSAKRRADHLEVEAQEPEETSVQDVSALKKLINRSSKAGDLCDLITPEFLGRSQKSWNTEEHLVNVAEALKRLKQPTSLRGLRALMYSRFSQK
jgi:hypothetical protein